MRKDIKNKWIKALRSGKFKQGYNALCKHGEYCCLGVLLESSRDNNYIKYEESNGTRIYSVNGFLVSGYVIYLLYF